MPAAPSFLIRSTRVVPIDASRSHVAVPMEPVDVLVVDGVVAEVGPRIHRPDVAVHDAEGRWLVPGLWDQHVHMGQWTAASQRLDLAGLDSPEAVLDLVALRLRNSTTPVIGWGHRPGGWARQPTVRELDQVSGDRSVVLISGDGHHAWLNTAALRRLGLPERDGVVAETEWFATYPRLAVLGADDATPSAYRETQLRAAALGVVGLVDLEFDQAPQDWSARAAAGGSLLRVRPGVYPGGLDDFLAAGLRTGDRLDEHGLVTMGPLKIISDGSLNTRTAWCLHPYAGPLVGPDSHGAPNLSPAELHDLVARAHAHGLDLAVHAIGDAAVQQALDVFAATGARGSIEHAQLVTRGDSKRMAGLGVRASVQPAHLLDDRDLSEQSWPGQTERCFATRWLLDDGVEVVFGSDAPVSPLDPWLAMAAAVHRSADDRDAWHPEQAVSPVEALAASTDGHGTVGVGSPADLALLDADPLAVGSPNEQAAGLRSMTVAATWVAGSLVHASSGFSR